MSTAANTTDLIGRELGDYRVLRRLGSGGMADVYLAEQKSLGRRVALKVLLPTLASDDSYVARFNNEARAAASLVHPNIVQIYEVGHDDRWYFIAQEYVPGKNLGELIARQGSLDPRIVLDVLRQVAAALGSATEAGIVHRDIKPENLILSHAGDVKVADFGLARVESDDAKTLTQVGVAMGTPLYMSPEQIEGRPVDVRSDLYSLGVTCYHLITGNPPHTGDTALAIALQHLNATPPPLENVCEQVPGALARVVHRLMAKDRSQRYSSPAELLKDLRVVAADAAQQGWGEGPDDWTLAQWVAASGGHGETVGELNMLMQQSAQAEPQRTDWRIPAAAVFVALLAGMALAAATQPEFYFAGLSAPAVEKADTVWGQIYRAKMAPSEATWLAVEANFPDADPYILAQARQGLVRYYLQHSEEYQRALPVLRALGKLSGEDERQQSLQAFTYAGFVIAMEHLGRVDEAREYNARLTPEMRQQLRRTDLRFFELLEASLKELG